MAAYVVGALVLFEVTLSLKTSVAVKDCANARLFANGTHCDRLTGTVGKNKEEHSEQDLPFKEGSGSESRCI
jgi:hypothetical protein